MPTFKDGSKNFSKSVDICLRPAQERLCIQILDLLLELWNKCVDDQKAYYSENSRIMGSFDYDKYYYPQILTENPKYAAIPSKARQDMYRRCCNTIWRHMIPKSGDREWPYKDPTTNPINIFFFCRYGIRFTNERKNRIWISNLHEVKLREVGYITDEDIPLISSGMMCYRRSTKRWHIRFIIKDAPSDYFEKRRPKINATVQPPIGIDLGIKRYATIASEDSNYQYPPMLQKFANPILRDQLWDEFKKIQKIDEMIKHCVDANMRRCGYDPENFKSVWSIPKELRAKIYHSRMLDKLYLRRARLYERLTNCRKDFIKKLCSYLARYRHEFICIENMDVAAMLIKGVRTRILRRRISFCNFSYFRTFLKQKCEQYHAVLIETDVRFPSTQECSWCHKLRRESLTLNDRIFVCDNPLCPIHTQPLDRDFNSARNMLFFGRTRYPHATLTHTAMSLNDLI